MRDVDMITEAMRQAHQALCDYIELGPRDAEQTLHLMLEILDRNDVVAARERLSAGFGLRVVK